MFELHYSNKHRQQQVFRLFDLYQLDIDNSLMIRHQHLERL
jgi:hypothetical protein